MRESWRAWRETYICTRKHPDSMQSDPSWASTGPSHCKVRILTTIPCSPIMKPVGLKQEDQSFLMLIALCFYWPRSETYIWVKISTHWTNMSLIFTYNTMTRNSFICMCIFLVFMQTVVQTFVFWWDKALDVLFS